MNYATRGKLVWIAILATALAATAGVRRAAPAAEDAAPAHQFVPGRRLVYEIEYSGQESSRQVRTAVERLLDE